jgi:hypothetical protein
LLVEIKNLDLKAFCLRLMDNHLPEPDWLESVGSLVATTPPSLWKDEDEVVFKERLAEVVPKFLRVESVLFARVGQKFAGSSFRVALTEKDGQERDRVVRLSQDEEREGKELEKRISDLLASNNRVSAYALSRLMWKLLEKQDGRNNS